MRCADWRGDVALSPSHFRPTLALLPHWVSPGAGLRGGLGSGDGITGIVKTSKQTAVHRCKASSQAKRHAFIQLLEEEYLSNPTIG